MSSTELSAWDDDWEAQADRLASQPPPVQTKPTKKEVMLQHEEENRRIWQAADSAELDPTKLYLEMHQNISFSNDVKPAVKLLSRRPPLKLARAIAEEEKEEAERAKAKAQQEKEDRQARAARERQEKLERYQQVRARLLGAPLDPEELAKATGGAGASNSFLGRGKECKESGHLQQDRNGNRQTLSSHQQQQQHRPSPNRSSSSPRVCPTSGGGNGSSLPLSNDPNRSHNLRGGSGRQRGSRNSGVAGTQLPTRSAASLSASGAASTPSTSSAPSSESGCENPPVSHLAASSLAQPARLRQWQRRAYNNQNEYDSTRNCNTKGPQTDVAAVQGLGSHSFGGETVEAAGKLSEPNSWSSRRINGRRQQKQ